METINRLGLVLLSGLISETDYVVRLVRPYKGRADHPDHLLRVVRCVHPDHPDHPD